MSELPNFISQEEGKTYSIDAPEIKTSWASKNIYKIMLWFSVAWFGIVLLYITKYFGWSNLFLMMPDEFGGFLAGVTLPLAAIWVIMAYIDRGASFKSEAKFLRAYMNQLVYPEEGGAQTAKAMADAIRSQVIELQDVTKEANLQSLNIKKGLELKVDEFSKLISILENYSSKTMNEFAANIKDMSKNFESMNEASNNAANNLKTTLQDFSSASQGINNNLSSLFSGIAPQITDLKIASQELSLINNESVDKMTQANELVKSFAEKTVDNINIISKGLFDQTTKLEQISQQTVLKVEEMHINLNGSVNALGKTLENQSKFVVSHVKDLDKANEVLSKKMSAQGEVVATEVDKVLTRSSFIAEAIENQVSNINTASEDMMQEINRGVLSLKSAAENITQASNSSASNLNTVVDILSKGSLKIEEETLRAVSNIEGVDKNVQLKVLDWSNAYKEISQKYQLLADDITQKTQDIKNSSLQAVDDIKEVGEVMDKYSTDITQTCSLVVAQNKQSEISLSQQQKNLNVSISSLEDARAEIKKQIEELSRAALVINDEAVVAINNLKAQMEDTLRSSEDVVVKTQAINDNLKAQSTNFEESTDKTLNKMTDFNIQLNDHYKTINTLTNSVVDRSDIISNTLKTQLNKVDETTEVANKKYSNILALFNEQTQILNSVTQNTVSHIANVVNSLDDKAEAITSLFKHQEVSFFDMCDKLSDNTSTIANMLKKHTNSIESSADKAFSKMSLIEEDLSNRADLISKLTSMSIDKISEVKNHLQKSSDSSFEIINSVEQRFINTSKNISDNLNNFSDNIRLLEDQSTASSSKLAENANVLKDTNSKLSQDTKIVYDMLATQNSSLDSFLLRIQSQATNLKEVFDAQKETLTDVANVVATQARLGESSLAQQYKILSEASVEVSQKLTDINLKFKDNVGSITDLSGKVAYEIDTLGDRLINISQDVEKSSKQAIKNVSSVNLALSQCEEGLNQTVQSSSQKVGEIVKDYQGYIANFNTVTAEASTGVVEINNLILDQSDKMIKISEDTKDLVTCFNTVLNDTSLELSSRANFAFEKVKGLGENLKSLSNQLEEAGKLGSKHLETSGDKLRATMKEVAANAERISNSILGSGETFLKQSDVLVIATDDAFVKVKNVMDKLEESSKTFSIISDVTTKQTANFSEIVDTQIKSLTDVAGKADKKLSELLKGYESVQTEEFLKEASYVIETLETTTVDIIRLLNPENAEELWKKYYNGENNVFTRYLAKNLTKTQVLAIKKIYEDNQEFRKVVTRYLSEYEGLLAKAQQNERAGVLLSVITSADIGKVYYIIARALDKLN